MNNDDLIVTNEYSDNCNLNEKDLEEYISNKSDIRNREIGGGMRDRMGGMRDRMGGIRGGVSGGIGGGMGSNSTINGLSSYTNYSNSTINIDGFDTQYNLNNETMKTIKRTTVSIDSINRIKQPIINKISLGKLPKNPFKTQIGNREIKVWCPYQEIRDNNGRLTRELRYPQFQASDIGVKEIIFTNLRKDISEDKTDGYDYYNIGLQREYIEFDNNDIVNRIFVIKSIGFKMPLKTLPGYEFEEKKQYQSDYFVICLNERINTNGICKTEFGGENVCFSLVTSFTNGYENSAHYKIDLGKQFTNIYMVKLKSIVLPNTSYTINSREEKSNLGNFNVKTKINNKLKWVNKSDKTNIYNLSLYSDKVFSNSINVTNLILENNIPNQTLKQKLYSDEVILKLTGDKEPNSCSQEKINRIKELREEFNTLTNNNNIDKDFYLESHIHTDSERVEGLFDKDIKNNSGKYWLPNSYHDFTKTLIYKIFESLTKPYYTREQYLNYNLKDIREDNIENFTSEQKILYNRNIRKLLENQPWHYYYLNSLINKGINTIENTERNSINGNNNLLDFIYSNELDRNFKYLNDLEIPKYMGYYIFEKNLEKEGQQNSKFHEELIESFDENNKYIYPGNSISTDKLLGETLVSNNNILNLKKQERYPIYEVSLTDGKYNTKSFIRELQEKLSGTYKKTYNGQQQIFENRNFNLDKFDFQPIFNVNVNKNLNLIDIRQYNPITKYIETSAYNPNLIYYNEGIPLIAIKLNGHNLNSGDKILITGAVDTDNIDESNINGEHIIKVNPSFKIYMRMIYPLPELAYLDQNKYFNKSIGKNFNLEDKTTEFKIKRDLRKFLLKSDDLMENIPESNLWYGANWDKDTDKSSGFNSKFDNKPIKWEGYRYKYSENSNNKIGNTTHSKRELYPLKYISNDGHNTNLTYSWNNPYLDTINLNSLSYDIVKGSWIERRESLEGGTIINWKSGRISTINNNGTYNIEYKVEPFLEMWVPRRTPDGEIQIRLDIEMFGEMDIDRINLNILEKMPRSWNNVHYYNKITKPYELVRYYGEFTTNIPYQYGIYYTGSNFYQIKNFIGTLGGFKELEPRSQKHLNEGNIIMSVKNVLSSAPNNRQFTMVTSTERNTLNTNLNYYGGKMINSVNNGMMYPEINTNFGKNDSVLAEGIECSMMINETFVKLSDIKNITETTTIGRITQINNNKRLNSNGNFEIFFDLLTEIESGNFNIGDVIIGLDSNCIGMIVPESWEYCSLIEEEVINKGFGTYILEKYRNLGSINKIVSKATNTFTYKERDIIEDNNQNSILGFSEWKNKYNPYMQTSNDLNSFLKQYNNWSIAETPYSSQYIYFSIEPIFPSISRISGIKTTNLIISKPIEFKFIFDENTSPIDRLNIPLNQSFNFTQNNFKKFNQVNINKSYFMGLHDNTLQNYLVIETFEKFNFKKNDTIYIKDHKIINRNINNNKVHNLTIESVEPFRNYIAFIQNNYYNDINYNLNEFTMYSNRDKQIEINSVNVDEIEEEKRDKCSHNENNIYPVPFANINLIWDYDINAVKYCLGKDNSISTSYCIDLDLHNNYKTETTDTIICISKPIKDHNLPLNKGDIVRQYYNKLNPVIIACGTVKTLVENDTAFKKIINIEIENVSGRFIANSENYNLDLILDIKKLNKKFIILKFNIGDSPENLKTTTTGANIKINDIIVQGNSRARYVGNQEKIENETIENMIFETDINSKFYIGINSTPVFVERYTTLDTYSYDARKRYQEICPSIAHISQIIDPLVDESTNYNVIKVTKSNINELDTDAFEQSTEVENDWEDIKNVSSDYQKVYSRNNIYSGKQPNNNLNNLNLVQRGPYELFNNNNLIHFALRERLINWFFENPFTWNSNDLEKVLEFKKKYEPSVENKNIIIKLVVSPLDSYGWNFLKNGVPTFYKRAGNLGELPYKGAKVIPYNERPREGGYTDVGDNTKTVDRNVDTILPFLNGMGVYINNPFLEKYSTQESIEKFQNNETDSQFNVKLVDPFWDYERNEYIGESLNNFSNIRSNPNNKYPVGWATYVNNECEQWLGNYDNVKYLDKEHEAVPKLHNHSISDPLKAVYKRPVNGLIGYVLDTTIENIEDYIDNYAIKSYCLDIGTITKQESITTSTVDETITSNNIKTENLIGTPSTDCSINTYPPKGNVANRSYQYTSKSKFKDFKTTLNDRNQYDLDNNGKDNILGVTDTHKSVFSLTPFYELHTNSYTYNKNIEQYPDAYLIKTLKSTVDQNQNDLKPYKLSDWNEPIKPYEFAYTRQRWWIEKQLCNFNYDDNEIEIDATYPQDFNDDIDSITWQNVKPIYRDKSQIYIKQSLNYTNDTRYQHHKAEYISNSYLHNNNPNYRGIMKVEVISEFDGIYGLDSDYKIVKGYSTSTNITAGIGAEFIVTKNFYNKHPNISISNPGSGYDIGDIIEIIAKPTNSSDNKLKNYAFYACKIKSNDNDLHSGLLNFYTGDTILIKETNLYPAIKGIIPFDQIIKQTDPDHPEQEATGEESPILYIKMQTSTKINLNDTFEWTKINKKHGTNQDGVGAELCIDVIEHIENYDNIPSINFYPIQNLQLVVKEIIVSNAIIGPSRLVCNTDDWNRRGICEGYINIYNDNTYRHNDIKEIVITSGGGKYSPFLLKTIQKQTIQFKTNVFDDNTNIQTFILNNNNPLNIIQKTDSNHKNPNKILAHGQIVVGNLLTEPNEILNSDQTNYQNIELEVDRNKLIIALDKIIITINTPLNSKLLSGTSVKLKNNNNSIGVVYIDAQELNQNIIIKINNDTLNKDDIIYFNDDIDNSYTITHIINNFSLNLSIINGLFINTPNSKIYFEYYENNGTKHTIDNNTISISNFYINENINIYTDTIDTNFSKNFKFVFSPQPSIQKINGYFYPNIPNDNSINGSWLNRSQWWDGTLSDPQEWGVSNNFEITFDDNQDTSIIFKKNDIIMQKTNNDHSTNPNQILASGSIKYDYYSYTNVVELNIIYGSFRSDSSSLIFINNKLVNFGISSVSKRDNPVGLYNPRTQYKEEIKKIIPNFQYLIPNNFNNSQTINTWKYDTSEIIKNNIELGAHNGDFKARVNFIDFAPTYTLYLLVNKDSILFKDDDWIESRNTLNYNNISYLSRGTNIFYNIDKLKENNTVNNDECDQYDTDIENIGSDSNTIGSYYWRNRQAVATIFQGILEKNDISLIDNYKGPENNLNQYYTLPFIPEQNNNNSTFNKGDYIFREESIINPKYEPGGLDSIVTKTLKKVLINPKPNTINNNADITYNQAIDLQIVNDYTNLYYDLNISGNENYRIDTSDNLYKSLSEFVHLYGKIDGKDKYDSAESTNIEKPLFNNYQKANRIILGKKYIKPIYLISGHLDYFYNSFLQNKCILNLSKLFDKETKDEINNIQNIMETKEFNISSESKYNNYNEVNKIDNSFPKFESRPNVVNFENLDYLPIDSNTNIFIYNHIKEVAKYNDFANVVLGNSSDIVNCTKLQTNTTFNKFDIDYKKEPIGINDGAYSVIGSLWSGNNNNSIIYNKYKPGRAVLTNIDFTEQIEKGAYNKGNIRVKTKKIDIVGTDSKNYSNVIEKDLNCEFAAYIKYDNTGDYNIRGKNKLKLVFAFNCIIQSISDMFKENDLLFIGCKIHSNDNQGNYKFTNFKTLLNNSEIGIVKNNPKLIDGSYIEVELKNPLINDHNCPDLNITNDQSELVISRYKYGEIYKGGIHTKNLFEDYTNSTSYNRFIWDSDNIKHYDFSQIDTDGDTGGYKQYYDPIQYPYLVKIKRYIERDNDDGSPPIDYSEKKYIDVGDTICFDWGTKRYVDYINTEERLPPYDIIPTSYIDTTNNTIREQYKNKIKGELRYIYTQQFNRVLKKTLITTDTENYIILMLEKRPFIHYYDNTPFIIFKQTYRDKIHYNPDDPDNTDLTSDLESLDLCNLQNLAINHDIDENIIKNTIDTPISKNILINIIIKYINNNKQNNINFNCISTQPFTYNNQWYTKIFYQGDKPITTTYNSYNWKLDEKYLTYNESYKKYKNEYKHRLYSTFENFNKHTFTQFYKKYQNDDIQNDLRQGCKIFNNNLKKNINIDSMKGIDIPLLPIPNLSNNEYYSNLLSQNFDNSIIETNIVSPIINLNTYNEPVPIEDFHNIIENQSSLPIFGKFINYAELFDKYNLINDKNDASNFLNTLLKNYKTRNNKFFWEDFIDSSIIKNGILENINFRNQILYTYEDAFHSEKFYVFLQSILYNEIYETNSFDNHNDNLYNLIDKSYFKNYDFTPIKYNYIIIKGFHLGYGGSIREKNNENNIINNSDGWKILEVVNDVSNTQPNKIIIDFNKSLLNFNDSNYIYNQTFSKFNNSLNNLPIGIIDFDIQFNNLESQLFNNTKEIGRGGTIFMQKLSAPLNLFGNNYIYLCIPELKGQMQTSSTKIINSAFAKIHLPGESNTTLYNTFSSGTSIFNKDPLNTLDSIEICFLTDDNYLFDFNGLEHSFVLEIYEIVDCV